VKANQKAIEQLKQCANVMLVNVPEKDIEVMREGLVCHTFGVNVARFLTNDSASVQSHPAAAPSYPGYQTTSSAASRQKVVVKEASSSLEAMGLGA
jgi:hypothetical protein